MPESLQAGVPEDLFSHRKPVPDEESCYRFMDAMAAKPGISKRTLQRKLTDENTSFQKQLNSTRELPAKNYIRNTDMSISEYKMQDR